MIPIGIRTNRDQITDRLNAISLEAFTGGDKVDLDSIEMEMFTGGDKVDLDSIEMEMFHSPSVELDSIFLEVFV
jgi:hypothetical protein